MRQGAVLICLICVCFFIHLSRIWRYLVSTVAVGGLRYLGSPEPSSCHIQWVEIVIMWPALLIKYCEIWALTLWDVSEMPPDEFPRLEPMNHQKKLSRTEALKINTRHTKYIAYTTRNTTRAITFIACAANSNKNNKKSKKQNNNNNKQPIVWSIVTDFRAHVDFHRSQPQPRDGNCLQIEVSDGPRSPAQAQIHIHIHNQIQIQVWTQNPPTDNQE